MRETPSVHAPEIDRFPELPKRDPLPPYNAEIVKDRLSSEFKDMSKKELAFSEFYHLLTRYVHGAGDSIAQIASYISNEDPALPKETRAAFSEIRGLAVRFEIEALKLVQSSLGLDHEQAERAMRYYRRTHDTSTRNYPVELYRTITSPAHRALLGPWPETPGLDDPGAPR